MAGAIWCVVEDDRKGMPKKVMAEVIGEAARLGGPAEAVWLTDKASDDGFTQLAGWGATKVWLLENAAFSPYRGEVWAAVVAELATKESPKAIFGPVTSRQRECLARLAARLGVGLCADAVGFKMEGEQLVGMRPVYAGKIMSKVTWAKSPWVATLRPNVFRPADAQPGKTAQIEKPTVTIPAATLAFVERREETSTGLPELAEAETVISGGRVQMSVIGNDVRVNSYCEVSDSIIYNHVNIGRHSRIRRAIIDRHVSLPERTEIGYDLEADKRRFHITDSGIVVVVRQESLIEEPESA